MNPSEPSQRRGTLPKTPEAPPHSRVGVALTVVCVLGAIVAAFWVTIAEPGFVRSFHNWQARTLGGGYYPQLTWVLAMAVFVVPPVGIIMSLDETVQRISRPK